MKTSIKQELSYHLLDLINYEVLTNENRDDWHFYAFNEDYYLVGYYECSKWLDNHGMDAFEAIGLVQKYEIDNFGESTEIYDNSERVVNMLAYIFGEEILNEFEGTTVEELKEFLEEII